MLFCTPYHWHLGEGSGYSGGRCSWGCGCQYRLGKDFSTCTLFWWSRSFFFCHLPWVPGAFLAIGLEFWGQALVLGCGWVGHGRVCWGLNLGPSLPFSSKYIFIFWMTEGVRMELCAPGVALDDLQCSSPSGTCVNALHHLHFDFHIYCFHRQKTPEVSTEEVTFWS